MVDQRNRRYGTHCVIDAAIVAAKPPNQKGYGFFIACGLGDDAGGGIACPVPPCDGEVVMSIGEAIMFRFFRWVSYES